ncbi:hypothetical protein ANN_04296 [Periplaneta americana]|uniref:Reverse transcriptase domain-containing protein n=1 Tax=Periplaneta americana TaxID=6978 RepID=A0ABQ8T872_PERAM|nr:hypothetical protein ANN_04296 [Periplaneta americana]
MDLSTVFKRCNEEHNFYITANNKTEFAINVIKYNKINKINQVERREAKTNSQNYESDHDDHDDDDDDSGAHDIMMVSIPEREKEVRLKVKRVRVFGIVFGNYASSKPAGHLTHSVYRRLTENKNYKCHFKIGRKKQSLAVIGQDRSGKLAGVTKGGGNSAVQTECVCSSVRENPQTIRENTGILLEASKEIGLEVNPEKTKYMIISRDESILRNRNIKIGNLSFEEVEKFKYLGATLTNINDTREEIKHRINMGNACYYSVEKLLSSSLLSKNLKVRIYKTVILPVALYGCETWTLTLREKHKLRVFENKVLRKIFGAKRDEVTGEWRKLHNTELHALYSSTDIIRNIKYRRLRWAGHVARMGESINAYRVLVGRPEEKDL